MGRRTGDTNYNKGYRREIMKVLLTCGVVSIKGMHMLKGSYEMYSKKVKRMEKEGIVKLYKIGSKEEGVHKCIRLNEFEKREKKYMEEFAGGYLGHYVRYGQMNAQKIGYSQKAPSIKAYRESEVVMLMSGTNVRVYPDEKVASRGKDKIPTYPPSFYSSSEIKEVTTFRPSIKSQEERAKEEEKVPHIINTRILGVLISEGGVYGVYHTEKNQIAWAKSMESQTAGMIGKIINEKCVNVSLKEKAYHYESETRISPKFIPDEVKEKRKEITKKGKIEKAIIYGNNFGIFKKMYENTKGNKFDALDNGYEEVYILPYDKNGQRMTEIMTEENWEEELKTIYLSEYEISNEGFVIDCDGKKDNEYILLFCIPNITKLKKFVQGVMWNGNKNAKFTICCFDFQEEFVKEVIGDNQKIEIVYTSFDSLCEYKDIRTGYEIESIIEKEEEGKG